MATKNVSSKLSPVGAYVVVRQEDASEVTEGGIVLPGQAQEAANRGKVMAVGNGHLSNEGVRIPLTVKVGDVVTFSPGYGTQTEIEVDGESLLVIREDSILVIHEEE
tara:strand:+ start:894 stop:1214 length:321 start_codon:yes stop_codon:yes gene_type:complete